MILDTTHFQMAAAVDEGHTLGGDSVDDTDGGPGLVAKAVAHDHVIDHDDRTNYARTDYFATKKKTKKKKTRMDAAQNGRAVIVCHRACID